jgi:coenzyme F420-reducing hydrogenase delta subunit
VRPHVPWYVRWTIALPFLLLAAWLVWWAYDSGLELAGFHRGQTESELTQLRDQLAALKIENARLTMQAASFEKQAQIEHAANQETVKQISSLNDENARIQEDLSFFQSLTFSGKQASELTIHRLKVEHDTLPGEYRYRMLLVQSGAQRAKDFQGNLQLLVNTQRNGKKAVMIFPQGKEAEDAAFQLNFKYYQRVEHSFQLPPDTSVDSSQVRIYERGASEPKIQQNVSLS